MSPFVEKGRLLHQSSYSQGIQKIKETSPTGTRKIPCDEGKRREKKRMRMTIAKVAVVRDC